MLASKAKTARAAESQNVSQNVVFVSRNPGGTGARARPSKNVSQAARAGCPADLGTSQNVSQAFAFVSQSLAWSRVLVWPLERPPRGSRVGGVGGGPGSNGEPRKAVVCFWDEGCGGEPRKVDGVAAGGGRTGQGRRKWLGARMRASVSPPTKFASTLKMLKKDEPLCENRPPSASEPNPCA